MLKHCTVEELEALCCELAALPLALCTENGLMRDSAKAKMARDLGKKWGVIIDSIEPSLIVFDGGMLLNHLNSRDIVAPFAEQVIKHRINDPRNHIKRPKIQATKEIILRTTSEIFCSHPTNKQRLVDIVADPINDSSLPNLSTRRSDSDGYRLIVMTVVKLAASGLSLNADDSNYVFLCLANLKQRTSS